MILVCAYHVLEFHGGGGVVDGELFLIHPDRCRLRRFPFMVCHVTIRVTRKLDWLRDTSSWFADT